MSFGGIGSSNSLGNSLAHSWATGNFGSDSTTTETSVAAAHLQKLGWKHGEGLGKKRDGINRAISVGFKNDTKGIGAASNEFGFSWWDHVFNKAATQIKIDKDEESGEIAVKVEKHTTSSAKKLLYGSFTTAGGDEVEKDYSIKVTDEELFAACEGRTARKGARVEQPGKLVRASKKGEEVEEIVAKLKGDKEAKRSKKEKKRKHEEVEEESGESIKKKKSKKQKEDDDSPKKKRKEKGAETDVIDKKPKKSKKARDEDSETKEVDAPVKVKKSKKSKSNSNDDAPKKKTKSDGSESTEEKKSKKKTKSSDE